MLEEWKKIKYMLNYIEWLKDFFFLYKLGMSKFFWDFRKVNYNLKFGYIGRFFGVIGIKVELI